MSEVSAQDNRTLRATPGPARASAQVTDRSAEGTKPPPIPTAIDYEVDREMGARRIWIWAWSRSLKIVA